MLNNVKEKLDLLLEANKDNITKIDFTYIKAYIDVLFHLAKDKDINEKEI